MKNDRRQKRLLKKREKKTKTMSTNRVEMTIEDPMAVTVAVVCILWLLIYWYQGLRRIQCMRMPASVRNLIEAASAARTVSLTDCIKFWALPTNMSVASWSSSVPWAPSIVALTVERILSWVPMVGIRSQTCSSAWKEDDGIKKWKDEKVYIVLHTVRIRLSVHCRANSLANRVTSSDASAIALAQAIRSRLLPPSPRTSWDRRPIKRAILLAAAMISLSLEDHCRTSWCKPWAAICHPTNNQSVASRICNWNSLVTHQDGLVSLRSVSEHFVFVVRLGRRWSWRRMLASGQRWTGWCVYNQSQHVMNWAGNNNFSAYSSHRSSSTYSD